MFEVNGVYANRNGKYTVIAINPPKMTVRYEDGSEADLRISLQERIWENIEVEFRAAELSRMKSEKKKRVAVGLDTNFYIKVVSIIEGNDLVFPGWSEKVVMESLNKEEPKLKSGDRLLFYVLEAKTFIAVATITGKAKRAYPANYFYKVKDKKKKDFFPIDIDAFVTHLDRGYTTDSIDLESQPNLKNLKPDVESILEINEDDFELVAEMITEVLEELEENLEDVEMDYSEDDEV